MIGNISRAAFFLNCRRKAHNIFDLKLDALQPAEPLVIGGAYHKGAAVLTATKDRKLALQATEEEYRERIKGVKLLPEEKVIAERNIELARRMVNAQADIYEHDDWQVLQPEVEFCVALPRSIHHCIFFHNILHPERTLTTEGHDVSEFCTDPRCMQPHWFRGKSDALLAWKNMTWILERKTSGLLGDMFWNRWHLDIQPTGYIYGVWKGAGVKPNGFIMEKVTKPRKNASDPFHITIEREPYLRTDSDLQRFELEFSQILTDMERAYVEGTHYQNTGSCLSWNRKCDFHGLCKRNYELIPGEFRQRDADYIETKYYELLGLPLPDVKPKEESHELDA